MGTRTRKLVGSVVMIVLVIVYALTAMALAQGRITEAPPWAQVVLYALIGLLWIVPAMVLIRWMEKPGSAE
jgi:RsiW-degrading membrane proteinase PrsW (M82 family)